MEYVMLFEKEMIKITKAIEQIKREDYSSYKKICKRINFKNNKMVDEGCLSCIQEYTGHSWFYSRYLDNPCRTTLFWFVDGGKPKLRVGYSLESIKK